MRTVDPSVAFKKNQKPPLNVSRPLKFGIKRSNFEIRLRRSVSNAVKEWLNNSSIEGVKFIVDTRNPVLIRWCYFILLVGCLACGVSLVGLNYVALRQEPPLVVNKQMLQQTLQYMSFPAVGICSYNVISRAELDKYAKHLFSLDKNRTYTLEKIKQNLRAFGAILTKTIAPFDPLFMHFLGHVGKETNVTNIIFKLSPKCKSLLVRCEWRMRSIECKHLFTTRVTTLGFCCIFNSRYHPEDNKSPPYKLNRVGLEAGLSVAVREDPGDTEYLRRPSNGIEVILFEGTEYPVLSAGVIRSYPAQRNSTVLMRLWTHANYAASELRYYSDESRGCRWAASTRGVDERSWSHCVARCHRYAAEALCGCVPYTLYTNSSDVVGCSPEHLFCLAKHREKFLYLYPGESSASDASLSEEVANSLDCAEAAGCRHDCSRQQHSAECLHLPHGAQPSIVYQTKFLKGLNLVNTSVIHLFYTSADQHLYLLETNVRWYEAIVSLGSQWLFLVAIKIPSLVEILYHFKIRVGQHYARWGRERGQLPRLEATFT